MRIRIDDRDLAAFMIYAKRELSLDASLRASQRFVDAAEHERSVAALRELNTRMLFRDTRRRSKS